MGMKKMGMLGTSAIGSAAFAAFVLAAPAYGQATQPSQDSMAQDSASAAGQADADVRTADAAQPAGDQGITVTGTRIRRPNLQSPVPITSLTAEELPNQGQASIGDALNDLPSLRSTFSQQNSGRFIGTAGLNELDLRGLGT